MNMPITPLKFLSLAICQAVSLQAVASPIDLSTWFVQGYADFQNSNNTTVLSPDVVDTSSYGGTNGSVLQEQIAVAAGGSVTFNWDFTAGDSMPNNDFAIFFVGSNQYLLSNVATVGDFGDSGVKSYTYKFNSEFVGDIGFVISNAVDIYYPSSLTVSDVQMSGIELPIPGSMIASTYLLGVVSIFIRKKREMFSTFQKSMNSMNTAKFIIAIMTAFFSALTWNNASADAAPFLESRGNSYRTGVNLRETVLNTSNVNHSDFGLLFTMPVDNDIRTQPLYLPNVTINKFVHNVVYITTVSGSIYAYDADAPGAPLWFVKLNADHKHHSHYCTGIIDSNSNTFFTVEALSTNGLVNDNAIYISLLHAIDVTTGKEKPGSPFQITANYTAPNGSSIPLPGPNDSYYCHAGLAFSKNNVIVTLNLSQGDEGVGAKNRGIVIAYDKQTLQQTGMFITITQQPASGGGIWQSGRGPVVDDQGYIYLFTGNSYQVGVNNQLSTGGFDWHTVTNGADGVNNFAESLLKFDSNLNLVDWFTPSDWLNLDQNDMDLGASGPILIPGTKLLFGGGKEATIRLLHTDNLGKFDPNEPQVLQKFKTYPSDPVSYRGVMYSGPIFWQRSSAVGGSLMYNQVLDYPVTAYAFNGNVFNTTPVSTSNAQAAKISNYSTALSLSANNDLTGTGILWQTALDLKSNTAILHAYNAADLTKELWNSNQYITDNLSGPNNYVPPVVSNGKVYVQTLSKQLVVYGLTGSAALPTLLGTVNQSSVIGKPAHYTISARDPSGNAIVFSASGLPQGLSIDSKYGIIKGVPTLAGTYPVTVTVTNPAGGKRSSIFSWVISQN